MPNPTVDSAQTPVLPARVDCERELASQLAQRPNDATERAKALGLRQNDFYNRQVAKIYAAEIGVFERGGTVASRTELRDELRRNDCFLEVKAELDLLDSNFGVSDIGYLVAEIKKTAALRHARSQIERIGQQIDDGDIDDPSSLLHHVEQIAGDLRQPAAGQKDLFQTTADLSEIDSERDWLARGYVARGVTSELIGKIKGGKTTLALALARAAATGGEWLGRKIERTSVIYLTEQAPASFRAQAKRAGLLSADNVHVLFLHTVRHLTFEAVIELALAKAREVAASLLVVDTFSRFARVDDENSSSESQSAMSALNAAAASGLAVLSLRHGRKSGGDVEDAGRGSSAISGAADIVILLQRPQGNHPRSLRELVAISRFGTATPERLVIEFANDTFVVLGLLVKRLARLAEQAPGFKHEPDAPRLNLGQQLCRAHISTRSDCFCSSL